MKSVITAFVIFSFVGIAVFGVFAMSHGMEQGHTGCIAATAQGTDCPKAGSILSFIAFHLETFRSFSTATFGQNILSLFPLIVSLILLIATGRLYAGLGSSGPLLRLKQSPEPYMSPFQQQSIRWLALHKHSPAVF